jgi:uncharacterized protein involved in exopolysaccharide biosynthesis
VSATARPLRPADAGAPAAPEASLATWAAGTIRRWRIISAAVLLAWATAGLAMLILPPAWRAKSSFTPNVSPSGSSGRLSGALGALAGGAVGGSMASSLSGAMGSDPSESPAFYQQLLGSRELLTRLLLSRFPNYRSGQLADSVLLLDLVNRRTTDRKRALEKEIKNFQEDMAVSLDNKSNLVAITVDAEFPPLAADIANRAVELVNEFNKQQRQTRGRVRRIFLAQRVDSTKADLDRATGAWRDFRQQNRDYSTSPNLKIRDGELQRQADIAEDIYVTTRRDYESARVAEINDAALITVVDSAVEPRKRQFPRIGLTLAVASVVGLVIGLMLAAIAAAAADWARQDPTSAAAVRGALSQAGTELRAIWRGLGSRRAAG